MKQRMICALLLIGFFAPGALARNRGSSPADVEFKKHPMYFLRDQISALSDQLKALKAQIAALSGSLSQLSQTLADLEAKQAKLQSTMSDQSQRLEDMQNSVSQLQVNQLQNSTTMTQQLTSMRSEEEGSFKSLSDAMAALQSQNAGQSSAAASRRPQRYAANPAPETPAPAASASSNPAPSTPVGVTRGYVTAPQTWAKGDLLTINLGSSAGLRPGSRLDLYDSTDTNLTKAIGLLEVTDVIDADNCHAKVIKLSADAQPQFSDIVRPR